jgi:hypothetical protein
MKQVTRWPVFYFKTIFKIRTTYFLYVFRKFEVLFRKLTFFCGCFIVFLKMEKCSLFPKKTAVCRGRYNLSGVLSFRKNLEFA